MLSPETLEFAPGGVVELDRALLKQNVRGASRGSAHGPSGHRFEHFRLLLEDPSPDVFKLFEDAAEKLARADVPPLIAEAFRVGYLTALEKPDGGVRGICAGDAMRRMVARTTVQQYSGAVEIATAPHEFTGILCPMQEVSYRNVLLCI